MIAVSIISNATREGKLTIVLGDESDHRAKALSTFNFSRQIESNFSEGENVKNDQFQTFDMGPFHVLLR